MKTFVVPLFVSCLVFVAAKCPARPVRLSGPKLTWFDLRSCFGKKACTQFDGKPLDVCSRTFERYPVDAFKAVLTC